ncbi:MAG TPA: YceD family protein [Noviherbaspirillum sp.]|uniref:YceD family protein n=1 Tax=Noviherbaspirillum sp. TaxID=1926288 RepID=UPI002B4AA2CC|nr:YceD family protein [Noviherbaspirillum sp.]HJV87023.1 YceD family protein [Noviherbaspirillum sp.]
MIDAFEFCRLKERREGEIAIADLPRLADESADRAGSVSWELQGGVDERGHAQLILSVKGAINLMCQRCLTPFSFEIASESILVLASDEASADEIDAQLADEAVEVIVGSRNFNITQLVEDDVLLAIPSSPKHEVCPDHVMPTAEKAVEKESPFAVLKNLKK